MCRTTRQKLVDGMLTDLRARYEPVGVEISWVAIIQRRLESPLVEFIESIKAGAP